MRRISLGVAALSLAFSGTAAFAQNVKITPLGTHDGEFCVADRAMVFEDPDGTRILYDAGRSVRGPDDPRLGKIDAVLLSHVHGDHLGDIRQATANAGDCAKPDFSVKAAPTSNTVDIAVGKKAKLIVGGEMAEFFTRKVRGAGGEASQVQLLRFGGSTKVGGVMVSSVLAIHSNGLNPVFLGKEAAEPLEANALTAYVGPPGGYVVRFSNGLTVYLSGDTGVTADQDLVVKRMYKANLAVMNIGGTFSTGPVEAAYVINNMVQPKAVIASHANEPATKDGKLLPGTKTEAFKKLVKVPTYVPLSGKTLEFNGAAKCMAGC